MPPPPKGMQAVSNKVVNFDKLWEVTQDPDENPASFLNTLTEVPIKYTKLDLGSPLGATILETYFISQSAPDIRKWHLKFITPIRMQPHRRDRPNFRKR